MLSMEVKKCASPFYHVNKDWKSNIDLVIKKVIKLVVIRLSHCIVLVHLPYYKKSFGKSFPTNVPKKRNVTNF